MPAHEVRTCHMLYFQKNPSMLRLLCAARKASFEALGSWPPEQFALGCFILHLDHHRSPLSQAQAVCLSTASCTVCTLLITVCHSVAWPRARPTLTDQPGLQPYAWTSSPQRCVQGSLRPACRRRRSARRGSAAPPTCNACDLCRFCRRARSALRGSPRLHHQARHRRSSCSQSAGALRALTS